MIALEEYISVFELASHRSTKAQKCHDATTRRIRDQPSTPLCLVTSGRRSTANVRSSGLRYRAEVERGVSGKKRKP